MNFRQLIVRCGAAALLFFVACQNPQEEGPGGNTVATTVRGTVLRSDDGALLADAVVQDIAFPSRRDTSNSNGEFSITYDLTEGQTYTSSLFARLGGFGNDTVAISLRAGVDTTVTLTLLADSASPQTGKSSKAPASIVLIGTDVSSISIRGSGVNESALLTFEVRDSLGNPVTGKSPPTVQFSIVAGPGGGEYVSPTSAKVNSLNGRVSTRLNSGSKPGVIQVQASARGDSVISGAARITIASGPPDRNNVSISREKANIPGLLYDNERVRISIILGDRYQNPVPLGTAVYFTTNGGIVQSTGYTDQDGRASVELISANPRPPGGIATITATTIGEIDTSAGRADSLISRSIRVTFSGAPMILADATPFILSDSGSYRFNYQVQDIYGNPLSKGTTIKVTVSGPGSGDVEVQEDGDFTLEDTDDTTRTNFSALIVDKSRGGASGIISVNVDVAGPNGDESSEVSGIVLSAGGSGGTIGFRQPNSISLVSTTTNKISVRGTGANETARLVFVVRDSLGNPVGNPLNPKENVKVNFTIKPTGGLAGGEFVFPGIDSTDQNGQVRVTFNAGVKAGVVQVVAQTTVGTTVISATPVQITIQGGLPDSTRFIANLEKVNMPGLVKSGALGKVSVQAGDEFGNPVQAGTGIYFTTNIGLVQASAATNESGQASVDLSGGVLGNSDGWGQVTVFSVNKSGESIRKYLPFLFTGQTLITGVPSSGFLIADSGAYSFSFRVADANGHPLVKGSTISVALSGAGAGDIELIGDKTRTMLDTRDSLLTFFNVSARDKSKGGPGGPVTVTITVTSENGDATSSFTGTQLTEGQSGAVGASRLAASLELVSNSTPKLSIRGTGTSESSTLTFVAKDAFGRPIDASSRAKITFSIAPTGGLGGGEFLSTTLDSTSENGTVSVTFTTGTKAGVVQIVAKTPRLVAPNDTIISSPVRITIAGGLPDPNRVVATLIPRNMPGLIKSGPLGAVSIQAGDKYNNPVASGTAFYFTTNLGLIQASATTSEAGLASVQLSGGVVGTPSPQGTVTLHTVGENGADVVKNLPFLFTGESRITGLPASGFTISDSGSLSFSYRVADLNGYPLVSGSKITVTASGDGGGDLALSGDVNVTMPDTMNANATFFNVLAQDKSKGGPSGPVSFTISVASENGDATSSFSGTQLTTGQSGSSLTTIRRAATLELQEITATTLAIRGTGMKESSTLIFVAKDSLGSPLDKKARAFVRFSLAGAPGFGEFLSTTGDSTNENGVVLVTFASGTKAGVVQVTAKTWRYGSVSDTISASPVRLTMFGGLPDSNRLVVTLTPVNMPGLGKTGPLGTVSVQAGDEWGNPVQPGTAFYFTTTLGLIQASATTNQEGQASVQLSGGVVGSSTPAGYVTVQTVGKNGVALAKTLPFLFTGSPVLSQLPSSGFSIIDGGSYSFSFKLADANGNPLPKGTAIKVTKDGPGSQSLGLSGNVEVTLPDTRDTSYTNFDVLATDILADGGSSGPVVFKISVISDLGNAEYSFSGIQAAPGQAVSGTSGTGLASSIELVSTTPGPPSLRVISVRGTGTNESATLRFVVKDSLGRGVDIDHSATITFTILGGTPDGEFVSPASISSDAGGYVVTTLNSGTRSRVVQVQAQTVVNGRTITSAPVTFTIHGGLPVANAFTVWASASNITGWVSSGTQIGTIFVQLGDQYNNPVQPLTAVYFTTNGGVITASAFTDNQGHASATLFGGLPFPPGGLDTITVRTMDASGTMLSKQITLTSSGSPVVSLLNVPTDTVQLFDGGFFDVDFRVADANLNPLAAGNSVSVSVGGTAAASISRSGDVAFSTIDTRSTSLTSFRVRLSDVTPAGGISGPFHIDINVSGPNGTYLKRFFGTLGAPQAITPPSPTVKNPAQIAFIGVSATDVYVSGVGALENSVITYEVRDSLGNPIEATPRSYVTFSLTFYPNSFVTAGSSPRLIPGSDSTDNSGRARVSMSAGTTAGVVQIVASVTLPGPATIVSRPVKITIHSGFPDQRHFTISTTRVNFPGLDRNFVEEPVTVQVADRYSNPVQAGTAVYFHSAHGTMETGGGGTDARGFIVRKLNSANPFPEGADSLAIGKGFSYVYAQTLGDAGQTIEDSVDLLWTGAPVILKTAGPDTFTVPNGGSAPSSWTFTVLDRFSHPMSAGTGISVSGGDGKIDGDANTVVNDTKTGGSGITSFTITLSDSDPQDTDPPAPTLLIVQVVHPVYGTFKKIIATGTIN